MYRKIIRDVNTAAIQIFLPALCAGDFGDWSTVQNTANPLRTTTALAKTIRFLRAISSVAGVDEQSQLVPLLPLQRHKNGTAI
jgi:hypothetical protein